MTKLYIISGPMEDNSFDLTSETAFVGRSPDNDIHINDPSISRKHAKIMKKGKRFVIEDLESHNGTWVNGSKIEPGHEYDVDEGLPVKMGKTVFSLGKRYSDDKTITHYSIDLAGEAGEKGNNFLYKDSRITDRKKLELIYEISTLLMQSLDIDEICEKIMNSLFHDLKSIDSGAILLIDDNSGDLQERIYKARNNKKDFKMHYSRTIVDRVIREGKAVLMSDTSREQEYDLSDSITLMRIKSIMCVPLISKSHIRGVIYAHSFSLGHGFLKDDLFFLTALSSPAALAIENALLYSRRKEAEEALRESEEKYRLLAETAEEIILTFDLDGKVTYANRTWSEISGYSQDETLGKGLESLVPDDELDGLRERLSTPKDGPNLYEVYFLSKSGERLPLEVSSSPLMKQGKQSGLLLIARDIRERKKMEEDLLRIQRLESIGTLAGGIAHDFNNLLTGVLVNVDFARMDLDPEDKIYKRLSDAKKACFSARELSQQFITFSRGGAPMKRVASITETIKNSANLALAGSDVTWECSIADDLWLVEFDESQIRQAIHQLVTNSKEAMPEGGTIELQAENIIISSKGHEKNLGLRHGEYVKISIQDQGVGIPKENLSKIFDPYFSTKEMGARKGMGLGLTTAFSIIKRHDGHVTVESELNKGTITCIYLPASKKELPKKKEAERDYPPIKGKILVMDDEEVIRDTSGQVLSFLGHNVVLSKDGLEAVDLYQRAKEAGEPFDAVILDLTVRAGMGAKEAIKRFVGIDPNIKAIVSSGYPDDPIITNFSKYGFSGTIAKPYNGEELEKVLNKVLRKEKE
ncbi:MAG: PAS domain S-box protein [Desulfobacteraceae bacterium]|nr:MAG: PAS domain S-box protein [Desulfobacteraceae bacterium]